jgi:hypothetical protein
LGLSLESNHAITCHAAATANDDARWAHLDKHMNPLWLARCRIFPGADVVMNRRLQRWLSLKQPLDYSGVRRALQQRAPYASCVYFNRLLQRPFEEIRMAL